jgi:outer membrane protein OmpA-like peptidoglycan-associated protein
MKWISFSIPLILLILVGSKTQAQILESLLDNETFYNYVPNNSFEQTSREYCSWNQHGRKYMEHVVRWDSPTETTPDIFSLRLKPSCWANPRNHSSGAQGPRHGDNMAGIKTYGKGGTETFWHEYLSIELDSALVPGQRYYAEFYANRAVSSRKASNNLGMLFSDTAYISRNRMPIFSTPQVNSKDIVKSRWNFWTKVSGVFEVESEKRFLIIGNFYDDEHTQTTKFDDGQSGAYYYIDDVEVRRAKPYEELSPVPMRSIAPKPKKVIKEAEPVSTVEVKLDSIDYKIGNTITLENIFFEFDKAKLLNESKNELDKLIDILKDYPHMVIKINGHTDNVGTDAYNKKLSEERAKSVVAYLKKAKVDPERLDYAGYGSMRPIASNDTDQGRSRNRRVEFTVVGN